MKLLIIGPKSKEGELLLKEAKKRKHQAALASIKDISFIVRKDKMDLYFHGRKLKEFDVCLLRGIYPFFAKAQALVKYLHVHKVRVIDKKLIEKPHNFSKIFSVVEMVNNNVPVIDTFLFSTVDLLKKHIKKIPEEVVVKDTLGMQSKNVFELKRSQLAKFFKNKPINQYLIQPKLDAKYYYRVFIVGRKVLGVMRRVSFFNPQRKKIKLARRSEKAELTPEIKKLALKAAKAAHVEIAGVDIIATKRQKKILEVNRTPQFSRFTEIMDVNVAKEIIKYLEKENRKVELIKVK